MGAITLLFVMLLSTIVQAQTPPCSTSGHAGNSYESCASNFCERLVCNGSSYVPLHAWNNAGWESIKMGNDTSTCDSTRQGRLRYTGSTNWSYCNGTSWVDW